MKKWAISGPFAIARRAARSLSTKPVSPSPLYYCDCGRPPKESSYHRQKQDEEALLRRQGSFHALLTSSWGKASPYGKE